MYVFDYGAPTGFRLALMGPERITAIISQNGNAYEEGLGDAWQPLQRYWREPTLAHRNAIRAGLTWKDCGTSTPLASLIQASSGPKATPWTQLC